VPHVGHDPFLIGQAALAKRDHGGRRVNAGHAQAALTHMLCNGTSGAAAKIKNLYARREAVDEDVEPEPIVPLVALAVAIPRRGVLFVMSNDAVRHLRHGTRWPHPCFAVVQRLPVVKVGVGARPAACAIGHSSFHSGVRADCLGGIALAGLPWRDCACTILRAIWEETGVGSRSEIIELIVARRAGLRSANPSTRNSKYSAGKVRGHASLMRPAKPFPGVPSVCSAAMRWSERKPSHSAAFLRRWRHQTSFADDISVSLETTDAMLLRLPRAVKPEQ
jgi:hypothetical protein